jgi:RNA polymerase sigma factor (sigma-70 family)
METIESHPDWTREVAALRRVARALLVDEHGSEDLLQDAWIRVHTRAEGAPRRSATFWRRVITNLARDRRRNDAHRREREQQAARPEVLPSSAEVAARLELAQCVARAAAELPEPYRSTIHLHYFEDLGAADIAARAVVPLETVRTRIRRGLQRMRERLDESTGGNRSAWSLVLAPVALRPVPLLPGATAGATVTTTGGLLVVSKLSILVAGAVAAVGLLWIAVRGFEARNPGAALPGTLSAPIVAHWTEPATGRDSIEQLDGERDARAALPGVAATAPMEPLGVDLAGTLLLIDDAGRSHTDVDGSFWLVRTDTDGTSEDEHVVVVAGHWSARVHGRELLSFRGIYADGHPAQPMTGPVAIPADGVLELVARAWPRTMLRVVDRSSGAELDGVELRWNTHNFMPMAKRHPGDADTRTVVRRGLRSPFEIELPGSFHEDTSLRLWVSAQDLAWAYCDVQPSSGGTRTVELTRGGDLEIYPLGMLPDRPWVITLVERQGNSREVVAWQLPAEDGVTRFANLGAGPYQIDAVWWDAQGIALGSGEVDVLAGETARVEIALTVPEQSAQTHLTGTLSWADGTSLGDLQIEPVSHYGASPSSQSTVMLSLPKMRADPNRPLTRLWDAGEVACGEYMAIHWGCGFRQRFHTGTDARFHIDIVLPPRVPVFARVLDARDGSVIPNAQVSWATGELDDHVMQMWTEVSDHLGQGFVRFEAPVGTIALDVRAPGWAADRRVIQLESGTEHDIKVHLKRETGLAIEFYESDALVPRPRAKPIIRDLAGNPVSPSGTYWGSKALTVLLEPGSYRLDFETQESHWRFPASTSVVVAADQLTVVKIALERMRD